MDELQLPHKLTLQQREHLTMDAVTEVLRFDENLIALKTQLGELTIQGQDLRLKTLSAEGGQLAVTGHICALIYEEPRQPGFLRRLFP